MKMQQVRYERPSPGDLMRRLLLLLLVLLVVATSATGVSASTDCERWIASYKQSLAQQSSVKRLKAAKLSLRRYARRKIAAYTAPAPTPKPNLIRASSVRPRLTPQQMLRRFTVLCGELPETMAPGVLDARAVPEFKFDTASFEPVDTLDSPASGLLAENEVPIFPGTTSAPGTTPGGSQLGFPPSFGPIFGGGGFGAPPSGSVPGGTTGGTTPGGTTPGGTGPGGTTPGGTTPGGTGPGGTTPIGGGGTPTLPTGPPDLPPVAPPPVETPVPEPGSIALLLTGAAGGAGLLRRRLRRF